MRAGRVDDVTVLLDHGAEIDAAGERGMTALHYAAMKGDVDAIRLLLGRGASPGIKDADGRTPFDWAIPAGKRDVISALSARTPVTEALSQ